MDENAGVTNRLFYLFRIFFGILLSEMCFYCKLFHFVDDNECNLNKCLEKTTTCENTPGSYICHCKPGFQKVAPYDDHAQCEGTWVHGISVIRHQKVNENTSSIEYSGELFTDDGDANGNDGNHNDR